jgi:hypothetical protein
LIDELKARLFSGLKPKVLVLSYFESFVETYLPANKTSMDHRCMDREGGAEEHPKAVKRPADYTLLWGILNHHFRIAINYSCCSRIGLPHQTRQMFWKPSIVFVKKCDPFSCCSGETSVSSRGASEVHGSVDYDYLKILPHFCEGAIDEFVCVTGSIYDDALQRPP